MTLPSWRTPLNQLVSKLNPSSALGDRIQDPYYRFQTIQEVQIAAASGISIDANQATVDDWLRLPGISIHQARTLVALTQSGVQFNCLEDVAAALSLSVQRLQPLSPILKFYYYDRCTQPVNPNIASAEQLAHIPAIDFSLARCILQNRQQFGPYRNLADLQQRLALPADLITEILHYLRF